MLFRSKRERLIAFVSQNGEVLVFTKENFKRNESEVTDYVDDDLSLFNKDDDKVQVMSVNIYEDVLHMPDQKLYSIPYGQSKVPDRDPRISKEIFNIVWNYLEGAKGDKRENQFFLKQSEAKIA